MTRICRRELILGLGGAITVGYAARAQQKPMPVIGYLSTSSVDSSGLTGPSLAAFREGLGETGYVEGQNVAAEYRWADGYYDRLPALAADLVARKVDVIAASGGGDVASRAAKNATSTIPIVFIGGGDPVTAGLVAILTRPGGTVTGIIMLTPEVDAKEPAQPASRRTLSP